MTEETKINPIDEQAMSDTMTQIVKDVVTPLKEKISILENNNTNFITKQEAEAMNMAIRNGKGVVQHTKEEKPELSKFEKRVIEKELNVLGFLNSVDSEMPKDANKVMQSRESLPQDILDTNVAKVAFEKSESMLDGIQGGLEYLQTLKKTFDHMSGETYRPQVLRSYNNVMYNTQNYQEGGHLLNAPFQLGAIIPIMKSTTLSQYTTQKIVPSGNSTSYTISARTGEPQAKEMGESDDYPLTTAYKLQSTTGQMTRFGFAINVTDVYVDQILGGNIGGILNTELPLIQSSIAHQLAVTMIHGKNIDDSNAVYSGIIKDYILNESKMYDIKTQPAYYFSMDKTGYIKSGDANAVNLDTLRELLVSLYYRNAQNDAQDPWMIVSNYATRLAVQKLFLNESNLTIPIPVTSAYSPNNLNNVPFESLGGIQWVIEPYFPDIATNAYPIMMCKKSAFTQLFPEAGFKTEIRRPSSNGSVFTIVGSIWTGFALTQPQHVKFYKIAA